jgi:prevent-host-death family protein
MARPYPVHEAKAKLSEILRRVKQGQRVTISERGREVARVVPIEPQRGLTARLEALEHDGIIVPGKGSVSAIRSLGRKRGALRRFLRSRA